jgi:hypothetical protein
MLRLLAVSLNYFWLDLDPVKSAAQYCDQHAFKIHSELVESVWDAFLMLSPSLDAEASAAGLPPTYRKRRHSKPGGKSHPLSRWNTLARGNAERSLLNAKCLFDEHRHRTGTTHAAYRDWEFLVDALPRIPYEGELYDEFLHRECLATEADRAWYRRHSSPFPDEEFTEPPRCINAKLFPGCDDPDVVVSYRKYYQLKNATVKAGAKTGFRYFYSEPPRWLTGTFYLRSGGKTVTEERVRMGRRIAILS